MLIILSPIVIFSFVFLFGTIIGSFLNVVILRYGTGESILGHSGCFVCGHILQAFDLIPIISYMFLSGKCRYCGSHVSLQYPLVEFSTGLLFLTIIHLVTPITEAIFVAVMMSILIVIFVYDIHHKIIPNVLVYAFIILGFIYGLVDFGTLSLVDGALVSLLAGPLMALPFFLLWWYSKGTWMGLGDAKLALGIGFVLSLSEAISAIILAFWLGSLISLGIIGYGKFFNSIRLFQSGKHLTMKSEIPFAPFLIVGFFIVFFLQFNLIKLLGY